MEFEYKLVIVTRKDLKLSPGKLAVQAAHAAVQCTLQTKTKNPKWFNKWQNEGAKKVVVTTEALKDFFPLKEKADALKIESVIIEDAGHTEIPGGTKTVLGIGPAPSNLIDQITRDLPLL